MDEQKEPLSLNKDTNVFCCPKCNFPLRSEDIRCPFCRVELRPGGWRAYYYYFSRYFQQRLWRMRHRVKKSGLKSSQFLKYFAVLGVGIALTLIGGYMFFVSMLSNEFSSWIISLFFLFYGIYTLKTLLFKK